MVFFICTFASIAFTLMWGLSNRHPVRPHPHLTGRPADPYWYTPTGRQDERGIRPWPTASTGDR
jgi:hypothetical protein